MNEYETNEFLAWLDAAICLLEAANKRAREVEGETGQQFDWSGNVIEVCSKIRKIQDEVGQHYL